MSRAHPLKRWIKKNTSQATFARAVQCSQSHLSDILAGRKTASLSLALKISLATRGAVSVETMARRAPKRVPRVEPEGAPA